VHGLDRIVWQAGWKKTPQPQKKQALEQLIASSDEWVIEKPQTMPFELQFF